MSRTRPPGALARARALLATPGDMPPRTPIVPRDHVLEDLFTVR